MEKRLGSRKSAILMWCLVMMCLAFVSSLSFASVGNETGATEAQMPSDKDYGRCGKGGGMGTQSGFDCIGFARNCILYR